MKFLIPLLLFAQLAQAGWWSDFCDRHLVADDPYQFETTPREYLDREIIRLETKVRWEKADNREKNMLQILKNEITRREELSKIINPEQ